MMGGYSAPPAVHSSLDRITEAETIIVTSQRDILRRNHGTRPGSGVGQGETKVGAWWRAALSSEAPPKAATAPR